MRSPYVVVVRLRGGSEKFRCATLDAALDTLERETRAVVTTARPQTARVLGREYEPGRQVIVRAELRGPDGLRAGLDVHGDGSAEPFTGRLSRRPLEVADGEDAWSALRRVAARYSRS
jgi:hypothetical protein